MLSQRDWLILFSVVLFGATFNIRLILVLSLVIIFYKRFWFGSGDLQDTTTNHEDSSASYPTTIPAVTPEFQKVQRQKASEIAWEKRELVRDRYAARAVAQSTAKKDGIVHDNITGPVAIHWKLLSWAIHWIFRISIIVMLLLAILIDLPITLDNVEGGWWFCSFIFSCLISGSEEDGMPYSIEMTITDKLAKQPMVCKDLCK